MAGVDLLTADQGARRPAVAPSSVVGFFVRRMSLALARLPFHEVTRVFAEFAAYHAAGDFPPVGAAAEPDDMELGPEPAEDVAGNDDNGPPPDDSCSWAGQRPSRRQAELLVSTQMELLQTNEKLALPPAPLQEVAARLLRDNPDLAEAHFLSFLNCLRVGELCGAVHSLYHSFDRMGAAAGGEPSRGLRYAALSLAALHARFGHRRAALAAIREAVTMSQDGNDSVCLQEALTWLYKLADDDETRGSLMRHAISKSGELQLHELASLGVQNYTELMAQCGARPADAFQQLARSDQINCQHSLPALLASGYAVRAALCALYGRPGLASLCGQLLLCLDTAGAGPHSAPVCGEPVALAAGQLARQLAAHGHYARADQLPLLDESARLLGQLEAWLLLKTVLHMRAVTWHELGDRDERNAAASQYRQLVTQHPTLDGRHLLRVT
ncbi:anaphase-promoting complex subunit 5-like [Pollicipes pollicipes]|uniref:anaphase-promoting complex subunit 5-like n=1 Tax=Pollicipes pollicipes TaxID=41117 RepID=UPI0018857406|nr:anaphase-promoting complex subunit 5-like [Pollicipes pollicipes]